MVLLPDPAGPSIAMMIFFRPVVAINLSFLHHEFDPAEHCDVLERIPVKGNDVRKVVRLERSGLSVKPEEHGGIRGCRA